jgi:outer membrane protein TolC
MITMGAAGRTRTIAGALAAVVLALTAEALVAQQIPQQLSLEEAQRLARLHNPEYRQAENDAGPAAAAVRARYGSFLPRLSTSMGFGGSHSWTQRTLDDFGRPISDPRTIETESSNASQGASLGLTLFDGGANLRQLSVARAEQRATDARIAERANQLRAQVARDYFSALRMEQAIVLEERLLAARKDELERKEKQLAVVASKYIDVLSARVQVASAEQAVDQARGAAEKARIALRQSLGVEGATSFSLATEPPTVFDPATLRAEALVQRALTSSPTVLAAQANVSAADQRTSVARVARLPTIQGSMSFGRGTSAQGYDAIGEFDLPNRSLSFNLSASLPLFSQFTTSAQIAVASAGELDARENLRRIRLTVEGNVRGALIDLGSAYRTVEIAQLKADLSREQLSVAEEEYRRGVTGMDFFRLQQIVDAEATAQRQLLEARFNFVNALFNLEERLGGPLER